MQTCYYYGIALWKARRIPVGLVAADWGGTSIEAWSAPQALDQVCKITPAFPEHNNPRALHGNIIRVLF